MPGLDLASRDFWYMVISRTMSGGPLNFPKHLESGDEVPRPETSGLLVRHVGELKGQVADWRASFTIDERGFHAVEFTERYECHLDKKDPLKDPLGHLVEDSPGTLALAVGLSALAIGATVYALSKRKGGSG